MPQPCRPEIAIPLTPSSRKRALIVSLSLPRCDTSGKVYATHDCFSFIASEILQTTFAFTERARPPCPRTHGSCGGARATSDRPADNTAINTNVCTSAPRFSVARCFSGPTIGVDLSKMIAFSRSFSFLFFLHRSRALMSWNSFLFPYISFTLRAKLL